jgi:hypothetical protein
LKCSCRIQFTWSLRLLPVKEEAVSGGCGGHGGAPNIPRNYGKAHGGGGGGAGPTTLLGSLAPLGCILLGTCMIFLVPLIVIEVVRAIAWMA